MTGKGASVLLVEDTPTLAFAYASHLRNEGLGEAFITYMSSWKGFVS